MQCFLADSIDGRGEGGQVGVVVVVVVVGEERRVAEGAEGGGGGEGTWRETCKSSPIMPGGGGAGGTVAGNSIPISKSSLLEKKVTRSVREGVGERTSPSSEEKVGDSGSASGDRSPGNPSGWSVSWRVGGGDVHDEAGS